MSKIKNLISRLSSVALLIATMLPLTALAEAPVSAATSTTMQGFDDSMCANNAVGAYFTLTDSRDGKSYSIVKAADNNCWMAQNLALGGATEIKLTSADSNVTSDYTLPAAQTSGSAEWSAWNNPNNASKVYAQTASDSIINVPYGNLYNWHAATAGTGNTSTPVSTNVSADICPKGWRLPDGGPSTDKSFKSLDIAMGGTGENRTGDTTSRDKYRANPYLFPYSGLYYYNGGLDAQGSNGRWWSRTAYPSAGRAYLFYLSSNNYVYPQDFNNVGGGFSVRCVLDNPHTPGETTVTANIEEVLSMSLYSSGSLGDKTYTCNTQNDPVCSGEQQIARTTLLPSQDDKSTMYTIATINTNSVNGYDLTIGDSDTVNALTATSGSTTIGTIGAIDHEPVGGTNPGWAIAIDKDDQGWSGTWYQVPISTATPLTIKSNHPTPAAVTINSQTKVTYGVAATSTQPTGTYTDTVVFTATTGV